MTSLLTDAVKRRQPSRRAVDDAAIFLTWYLVLLLAIPARLTFAPLGAAGTPAQLLGIAGAGWWFWHRVALRESAPSIAQPVRRTMLVFVAAMLVSFVAATIRPIDDTELRAAQMGLLSLMSWLGVLLIANDGLADRRSVNTLMRRVSVAAGCLALFGLLQFVTKRPMTEYIQIPGLSLNTALFGVANRGGLARPAGTAISPIEFGVVLAMSLPLALHYALHRKGRLAKRWFPVIAIAAAIPISISRSAILCTVVVLAFLLPTWSPTMRRWAATGVVGMLMASFVLVPGLLGTLVKLFTGIGSDNSALSRTGSFALAWEFIARAPVFGRGFFTFLPKYRILDNQYLGLLIDTGAVGLVSLLVLFVTGIVVALRIRSRSTSHSERDLALSLSASVAAGASGFAFFDAFSFPMVAGLMFLVLGCIGALRRVADIVNDSTAATMNEALEARP